MGLTLVAVLTGALLLPGIVAVWAFYASDKIAEVEPSMPTLGSIEGIALVGVLSVIVHFIYAMGLWIAALLPPVVPLPLANPYLLFTQAAPTISVPAHALSLFAGFATLCLVALLVGKVVGKAASRWAGDEFFYGPLADLVRKSRGNDDVIVAYVLGKLAADGRQIGYQGVLTNLIRDDARFPSRVILRDATIFYLIFRPNGPERREMTGTIPSIALSSDDWHNIAFRIFRFIDD